MVPLVDSREETMEILDAVKYPPLGKRGMNYGRGPRWGEYANYVQQADEVSFNLCACVKRLRGFAVLRRSPLYRA